jgi:hypothetical protein
MSSSSISPTPFEREVASRFGLVPNFFVSAPDAPEIIERLWAFAVSAYFDNPMPSLFKERLFVYLSRALLHHPSLCVFARLRIFGGGSECLGPVRGASAEIADEADAMGTWA